MPFGCYKKKVFSEIGLFDIELTRNQDDEFNARLREHGGIIWLIPSIRIRYFARDSIKKMTKMLYQYGYYKPLVSKKNGRPTSVRQLIPAFFETLLIVPLLLSLIAQNTIFISLSVFVLYALSNLVISFNIAKKIGRPCFSYLVISFATAHMAYGLGYWHGIIDHLIIKKTGNVPETNR